MEIHSRVFENGEIGKTLIKFAIPTVITLLITELYNMVDTIFVGISIGTLGVGALTIVFPIQRLISSIGLMIAIGTSTAVSRNLGEKNYNKIKSIILNAITITFLILSIITIFVFIFKNSITKYVLGSSETLLPYSKEYISIIIFGGLFQCFTILIGYTMMALGNSQVNMKATSMGALINIFLDYVLVVNLSMGIKGAAFATLISQIISCVYAFYKFNDIRKNIDLNIRFTLENTIIKKIIIVGFSTFIVEISDAVVAIILNNILGKYGGDTAVVIVGATTKVSMFLFITVIGISSAMQPIAAFNYGAKEYTKLKEVIKKTIKYVMITTFALWGIMFVFPYEIIGVFLKDENILNEAVKAFKIVISFFPCVGIYYIAIYYSQSMGKAKISFILSIYRQIIIFIPLVLILVTKFGIIGAWISYPISDIISSVTGVFYIKKFITHNNKLEYKNNILINKTTKPFLR